MHPRTPCLLDQAGQSPRLVFARGACHGRFSATPARQGFYPRAEFAHAALCTVRDALREAVRLGLIRSELLFDEGQTLQDHLAWLLARIELRAQPVRDMHVQALQALLQAKVIVRLAQVRGEICAPLQLAHGIQLSLLDYLDQSAAHLVDRINALPEVHHG